MQIRPLRFLAVAAALAFFTAPLTGAIPEEARQALRLCGEDIQAALATSGLPKELPLAILPVRGDDAGYVIGILKNAATGAGLTCVEGKEDPFFEEVTREVAWDERKDDILDPETLAKFGKLKGAKMLLYAFVRETSANHGRGFAEIEVHVSSIETKQHLWGGVFARRFYDPQLPVGPVDLAPEVRQVIRNSFTRVSTGLRAAGKLRDVHSVLLVPLAGDVDQFVTGLVENSLSATPYSPRRLDVKTLAEARALLRDDPKAADAIIYGAVRDLSKRRMNEYPDRTDYEINASVQLSIQGSPSGDVLWSDTVETAERYSVSLTWWEMVRKYGPLVLFHRWYILTPFIVLVGLIVLAMFFRAMRRAR